VQVQNTLPLPRTAHGALSPAARLLFEMACRSYRELFTLLRQAKYNRYTLAEVGESKGPERYMQNYKALWTELNRACC
jgi:hypothetical protein